MSEPVRVLVVDDSATARALLVAILGGDPEIQVVGEARDGVEGVELTRRLRVPLLIGLRGTSPDDWLEVRAGGYAEYRERCREALSARGLAITDL